MVGQHAEPQHSAALNMSTTTFRPAVCTMEGIICCKDEPRVPLFSRGNEVAVLERAALAQEHFLDSSSTLPMDYL